MSFKKSLYILFLFTILSCKNNSLAQDEHNQLLDFSAFYNEYYQFTQLGLNTYFEFQNHQSIEGINFKQFLLLFHKDEIVNSSLLVEKPFPPEILINPNIVYANDYLESEKNKKNTIFLNQTIFDEFINENDKFQSIEEFLTKYKNIDVYRNKILISQDLFPEPELSINPETIKNNFVSLYFDKKNNLTIHGINTYLKYIKNFNYSNKTFYQYLNNANNYIESNTFTCQANKESSFLFKFEKSNYMENCISKIEKIQNDKNRQDIQKTSVNQIYNTHQYTLNKKDKSNIIIYKKNNGNLKKIEVEKWKAQLFYMLLNSEKELINSIKTEELKYLIYIEDNCFYRSQNDMDYRICHINDKNFKKSNNHIEEMIDIFCYSKSNNLDKLSKKICNNTTKRKKYISQLSKNIQKNIKPLVLKTYQQEVKINGDYYPVMNANITIANYDNYYISYKTNISLSQLYVSPELGSLNLSKAHYLKNKDISRLINTKINETHDWECNSTSIDLENKTTPIDAYPISLIKLYKKTDENGTKIVIHPIIEKMCYSQNNKFKTKRAKVILDISNGMVLKDITILDKYQKSLNITMSPDGTQVKVSNNSDQFDPPSLSKIEYSEIKILTDNLFDLFGYISDDFNKEYNKTDLSYYFYEKKESCNCQVEFACTTNSTVCLQYINNIKANEDKTVVVHEYLHLIVPRLITLGCTHLIDCKNNLISFSSLFHDLTDILMMQYLGTKTIGEIISGQLIAEYGNNTFSKREINTDKDLIKNIPIPLQSKNHAEYPLGTYMGRMLQIANDLYTNHDLQIESNIKHWIRMLRAIKTYDFNSILCYECDLDFYIYMQKIMNAYWLQLIRTPDQFFIRTLLFDWAKAGYYLTESECIDSSTNNDDRCPAKNLQTPYNWKNFGLAHSKLIYSENYSLRFQVITGVSYFINNLGRLKKFENIKKRCNDRVVIEFYICESEPYCQPIKEKIVGSLIKPVNYKNPNEQSCLMDITIKPSDIISTERFGQIKYKSFFKKYTKQYGEDQLSYYIRTYKYNKIVTRKINDMTHDNLNFTQPIIKPEEKLHE